MPRSASFIESSSALSAIAAENRSSPAPAPVSNMGASPGAAIDPAQAAVSIRGLNKIYRRKKGGDKQALFDVDLTIGRGELFGLLGPNGAGKSTLINIMAQLVNKTSGTVSVWGHDLDREPRQVAAAIGVVPQELNIDPFFTPRELLDLQAGLYGVPRAERRTVDLLAAMRLTEQSDSYARSLSGGMRRRLMVAKAMVHTPPVLVLDEPTAGVDVELRQQLWAYVRELNRAGTTVLLTTHYLEEAEELCGRIAIINHGKLIACDTTDALLARLDSKEIVFIVGGDLTEPPPVLARWDATLLGPRRLRLRYRPSATRVGEILAALQAARVEVIDISTLETDLEDIFLQLTRRDDSDGAAKPAIQRGRVS
jgi:ABC-2 type transport system ATP-binding protein